MLSCFRRASPNQVFFMLTCGPCLISSQLPPGVLTGAKSSLYMGVCVWEDESCSLFSPLPWKSCAKITEAEKPETVWGLVLMGHQISFTSSYCFVLGYIILSSYELTNPCCISGPVGIIAILQMENGRCSQEGQIAPKPGDLAQTGSQLPWLPSNPLLSNNAA